ncbi:acyloxyacyl hydrolase [Luteimonas sp BLCC-B24]|uniref:acyloxyacyl hydrolase n=1 Tax=Luteimonas sp. BLCC-B24 TaxID=3025317 RepID=UPI00234CFC3B|nr:acyloxyacyl hydrolase [Luteimonas sp. BLCC-B24]MDC7808398.1 acyloxyacyl hydrolase [Luteimonas sp. BLCC-B24]
MRLLPALSVLAVAACLAAPVRAQSAPVDIGIGASATRENETTLVATAAWLPEWRRTARGVLRWELGAVYVRGRDNTRFDLSEDAGVVHGGARYERDNGFVAGFGVGVQAGRTDALSGNPQFVSTVGWRWQRFSLLARHISNASIRQPNDGETMLVAAWRFR